MPARLWRFMGTVDTGAGNGDAVYRDLVVAFGVLSGDVLLVGRYYRGVSIVGDLMYHCSSLCYFCIVIIIIELIDGFFWSSKVCFRDTLDSRTRGKGVEGRQVSQSAGILESPSNQCIVIYMDFSTK